MSTVASLEVVDFLFVAWLVRQPKVVLVLRVVGGMERRVKLEELDVGIFCSYSGVWSKISEAILYPTLTLNDI